MKSKLMQQDHDALIKMHKSMTPEERLMAFYHHSRLMMHVHEAGKELRNRSSSSSKTSKLNEK
jgi:hypothetical protein